MQLGGARLPSLTTYASALAHYEKIKPFNKASQQAGKRPLGLRRYSQCLISKAQDVVVLSLYGHPVITITNKDEILIKTCGYHTPTTSGFITHILGRGASRVIDNVSIRNRLLHVMDRTSMWYPLPDNKPLIYAEGRFVNANNIQRYQSKAKETRKFLDKYKVFLSYCQTSLSLLGGSRGWHLNEAHTKLVEMREQRTQLGVTPNGAPMIIRDNELLYSRFYMFDVYRSPTEARRHRTAFLAYLDKAIANSDHELLYLLFIRLCASLDGYQWVEYKDVKQLFINILKLQYPHIIFELKEVKPTSHIVQDDNAVFVRHCGDAEIARQCTVPTTSDNLTDSQYV